MKGFFTRARLSVASRYVYPAGQKRPYALGALIAIPLMALFLVDAFVGGGTLVSNGPLSSDHALFGGDCATCHEPFGAVTNARCESCHEKVGDPVGLYSFQAHYRYRSNQFDRSAPSSREVPCFACHTEHVGREQPITRVADIRCEPCHFDNFTDGHPEFEFEAESLLDPVNLFFPHTVHVVEVRLEYAFDDIERTCLYCHVPEPGGASFKPISFDAHCSECHLMSSTATPNLPVRQGPADWTPGVLTLEAIQDERGPGTAWAFYANPNEFQRRGDFIRKRPLYHADPWIMENLRRLRRRLYPTAELAELLRASADVPTRDINSMYEEALSTLREWITELRNEPGREVQEELDALEELVKIVEERLADPYSPLDETRFSISVSDENPDLSDEERTAYESLINDLTEACQECHFVERATIQAVPADQRTLVRAEYDHRAHVIHARCLDCHDRIPIIEFAAEEEEAPAEIDHAGIINLPRLATCQSCHASDAAADECVTCHVFHPDKTRWSNLLRYTNHAPERRP